MGDLNTAPLGQRVLEDASFVTNISSRWDGGKGRGLVSFTNISSRWDGILLRRSSMFVQNSEPNQALRR